MATLDTPGLTILDIYAKVCILEWPERGRSFFLGKARITYEKSLKKTKAAKAAESYE